MMDLFGPFPEDLIRRGKKSWKYFDDQGTQFAHTLREIVLITVYNSVAPGNLSSIRAISNDYSLARVSKLWNPSLSTRDACAFAAFLGPMLKYRPKDRKTADEMLDEAWLQ